MPAQPDEKRYSYEDYLKEFTPPKPTNDENKVNTPEEEAEEMVEDTIAIFEKALQK